MHFQRAITACAITTAMFAAAAPAAAFDIHFDYTSFDNPNSPGANPHFGQSQFNVLNYPSINGNFMMTSTDTHRPEMVSAGNSLAEFYNNFLADYNTQFGNNTVNAAAEADAINLYTTQHSSTNGPKPNWLVLNEISSSLWQPNPGAPALNSYRQWVVDCVTRLHDVYGYDIVTYAPFGTVGTSVPNNGASWQALSAKSYIGIESYLSGAEVISAGSTYAARLAWAQSQYQASKDTYTAVGVDPSRLFLGEDFTNNAAGSSFGRAGVSAADWDTAIQIRQDAIYNVGFAGFLAYAWGGNPLGISEVEQLEHEYYYRSRLVLPTQKPQWLSDSAININGSTIPLSWNQPLNWLGGVPNATGAQANFWRTLTADRAITLDGTKTIGSMVLDSAFTYTINPGSGGSVIFNNGQDAATLTSSQGSHVMNVGVQLSSDLTAAITANSLTINGVVSGAGNLTKTGTGTLTLTAANSYTGDTRVQAGRLALGVASLADSADVYVASGSQLVLNFGGNPDTIDALFLNGISQPPGIWGAIGSGAQFTSSLLLGTGMLKVTTFVAPPLVGDYNQDGVVNTADYVVWRSSIGLATLPNRDPGNSGKVEQADYATWRAKFGNSSLNSAAYANQLSVPEPGTITIACGIVFAAFLTSRQLRRSF